MGGNSFAVSTNSTYDATYPAWKAVDGSTANNNGCITAGNVYINYCFYNPIPIKVTKLTVTNISGTSYTGAITAGRIEVSDNGSDWTQLKTFTNSYASFGATWIIDLNTNTDFHKYYRLIATDKSTTPGTISLYTGFAELKITAIYMLSAINSITFPQAFTTTNYSYSLAYQNGIFGTSYATELSTTGITLQNNSNGTNVYYLAIGY